MLRLKIGLCALSERRSGHYEHPSFDYENDILRIVMLYMVNLPRQGY
jgi:hypothetical protein